MHKLDSNSAIPLYQQLYNEIKENIESGKYKRGTQIPSEDKLREMYGISRITVRKALEQLTEEEILIKKHGKGTFVAAKEYIEQDFGSGGSFTKSCLLMNAVPNTHIFSRNYVKPEKKIADVLHVSPEERILKIGRLRCVDGTPVILEYDYFTKEFDSLHDMDLEDQSLFQMIREKYGKTIHHLSEVVDIARAGREHAELLNCEMCYPLLRVCQRVLGTENRILYYNEQYILSDHYKYAAEMSL